MLLKKAVSIAPTLLTTMIWVLLSGIVLFGVITLLFSDSQDIESALAACRTSVEAREFAGDKSGGTARAAVPMLCKTIDLKIPEQKYEELAKSNFTKAVMMNIADRSMDCWWQFGEGMFDKNVFSSWGVFSKNSCFSCFTFTIKDHNDYKYERVSIESFDKFISTEVYKPIPNHKPFCLFDGNDEDDCVSRKSSECERKGGICVEKDQPFYGFTLYDGWSCDSRKKNCYVNPDMLETYSEYLLNRAYGVFTVGPELLGQNSLNLGQEGTITGSDIGFNKDKTYAIGFISHTRDLGWTVAGSVAATAGALLTVFTGGVFSIVVIGGMSTLVGTGVYYDFYNDIYQRSPPIIYISDIEGLENKCNVVGDFNQ